MGVADGPSMSKDVRRSSMKTNAMRDDPTDKYGKLYEESMNPFVQFHKRVRCVSWPNVTFNFLHVWHDYLGRDSTLQCSESSRKAYIQHYTDTIFTQMVAILSHYLLAFTASLGSSHIVSIKPLGMST